MSNNSRRDVHNKRCDSCGNPHSFKYYNRSYLCKTCYLMDNSGTPRIRGGKVYRNNFKFNEFGDDNNEKPKT